jgi:hypothetical protein
MFVRRIATVTICAPLSSTARRVSSKSLYFPVPISRRDEKVRVPIRSGSAGEVAGGADGAGAGTAFIAPF